MRPTKRNAMEKDYGHRPVLLEECLEALALSLIHI